VGASWASGGVSDNWAVGSARAGIGGCDGSWAVRSSGALVSDGRDRGNSAVSSAGAGLDSGDAGRDSGWAVRSTGALVGVGDNRWVAIGGHRGESNSVGVGVARRAGSTRALGDL